MLFFLVTSTKPSTPESPVTMSVDCSLPTGGAAENKRSIEIDGKKTKKVSFAKKLKIAKAYVAKIEKQAAEKKDSDDESE